MDLQGDFLTNSRHPSQIFHAGLPYTLQAAKMP